MYLPSVSQWEVEGEKECDCGMVMLMRQELYYIPMIPGPERPEMLEVRLVTALSLLWPPCDFCLSR